MGTDIHMIVEKKNDKGEWEHVPNPIRSCWNCEGTGQYKKHIALMEPTRCRICDPIEHLELNKRWFSYLEESPDYLLREIAEWQRIITEKGTSGGHIIEEWFDGRNYNVFAILANVRNGHGFAGVDTGDPWPYIQNGRDLPDGVCIEVTQYMSEMEHSPGWVTLKEIMDYPWKDTVRTKRGWVNKEQFIDYINMGQPPGWCGGVSGGNVRHISINQMMDLVKVPSMADANMSYYTKVSWQQTALETCEHFLNNMKELAMVVGEHECRIHFYFDS